jgi:quercetin dioxygenase-like cupin family protein
MPIEIRRFGVGHRRKDGPPGTTGVSGQVIHSDAAGSIAELAFSRNGRLEAHANPNTTWFIVIEGGGWVVVDGERARVAAGEAVLWPPDVPHGAWADHGPMRAFVVELAGGEGVIPGIAAGVAERQLAPGRVERGDGSLHDERPLPPDPEAGEPR